MNSAPWDTVFTVHDAVNTLNIGDMIAETYRLHPDHSPEMAAYLTAVADVAVAAARAVDRPSPWSDSLLHAYTDAYTDAYSALILLLSRAPV